MTLTAATLGWVHVPPPPVEATIALSIVFVAAEILRVRGGEQTVTARMPWLVAFVFGLMHGLGFAGGLSEAGLPGSHIPVALLFFSIGVEVGHFLFIGVVLAAIRLASAGADPNAEMGRPCAAVRHWRHRGVLVHRADAVVRRPLIASESARARRDFTRGWRG